MVNRIRVTVLVAIRRPTDGALLVLDSQDAARFFRPVGGDIEFGEPAEAAARRHIREELRGEITDVERVGVLEHIFVHGGRPRHELAVVVTARLVDESLYTFNDLTYAQTPGAALWVREDELRAPDAPPLRPDGLAALL